MAAVNMADEESQSPNANASSM